MGDTLALNAVHVGDIRELAPRLAPGSVNCVVTSPPYWRLRSYLDGDDPRKAHELGSEPTVEEFVANLVGVLRLLRPSLHPTATCWINLGDSYANDAKWGGATGGKHAAGLHGEDGPGRGRTASGLPPKCLTLAPARFAIAMVEDGWILRSEMTGVKVAPMPESVRDRPTSATERLYLFVKQPRYWYDPIAVAEPAMSPREYPTWDERKAAGEPIRRGDPGASGYVNRGAGLGGDGATRNARNWFYWRPEPFAGDHYAVMPSAIPRFAVRAGCPPRVCARCGSPWAREMRSDNPSKWANVGGVDRSGGAAKTGNPQTSAGLHRNGGTLVNTRQALGWRPTCACDAETVPGVVCDPFVGSGTTVAVAAAEGRRWIACDLDSRAVTWTAERLARTQIRLPLDLATEAAGG